MTATLLAQWLIQYSDDDGNPISGGRLRFFETGTSTPVAVFTDPDLIVPWSVPLVLDSAGRVPGLVYVPVTPALDVSLTDANDVPVFGPYGPVAPLAEAVEPPPACTPVSIVTQPVDQAVSAGDPATVSVVTAGTSPITYQLYLGSSGDTSNPLVGATGASYTSLPLAAGTYTAWFRCQNPCGTVDSLTVTVVAT